MRHAPGSIGPAASTDRTTAHPATDCPRGTPHSGRPGQHRRPPLAIDPSEEGFLDGLARLAQRGDRLLRDRLYERFRPYLDRVCAALARRSWVRLAELDDVRHEGYLVFCTLLADWPGEKSFAGFLFAHFARRLSSAVRRFEGLRPRGPLLPPPPVDPAPDHHEAELGVLELLTGLSTADRRLLELLLAGHTLAEAAAQVGISARTARRRLRRLRQRLGR